jgi:DNA-binding HxlR family transcriptional regulator
MAPAPPDPAALARITHHRWALPVLAELHAQRGSKFITLVNRLGAHRLAVSDALHSLTTLGLVIPNPGYGHPLRPEYILTARGQHLAPSCTELLDRLHRARLADVGLRKWTLPTLLAIDQGAARFSDIRNALAPATDRALARTLSDSSTARLVARAADQHDRRAVMYTLDHAGKALRAGLRVLAA